MSQAEAVINPEEKEEDLIAPSGPAPLRRLGESRGQYYDRWAAINREAEEDEEKEREAEEKRLKEERDRMETRASRKDKKANARLKAKREAIEKLKGTVISEVVLNGEMKITSTLNYQDERFSDYTSNDKTPAIVIKKAKDCVYRIVGMKITKLTVQHCVDTTIEIAANSPIVTEHVELYRCANVRITINTKCATTQADRCKDCSVTYQKAVFEETGISGSASTQIIHAHCSNITCSVADTKHSETFTHVSTGTEQDDLVQYLTHVKQGKMCTERVFRPKGWQGRPLTLDQLQNKAVSAQADHNRAKSNGDAIAISMTSDALDKAKLDYQDARAQLGECTQDVQSALKSALDAKETANKCFVDSEYAQAAYHYSEAILGLARFSDNSRLFNKPLTSEVTELHSILLSNRAACNLKLGQHDKAIEDAQAAVALNPANAKGHFRWGLALHVMDKPAQGLPHLGRALRLQPKSKQIQQAIKFAELKAAKLAKRR